MEYTFLHCFELCLLKYCHFMEQNCCYFYIISLEVLLEVVLPVRESFSCTDSISAEKT